MQTLDVVEAEGLFTSDYAYFSSFSNTWLQHASDYVDQMTRRFDIAQPDLWVEVAANDGYLLQYVGGRGIPCLAVEPTTSTAAAARERGIHVVEEFFDRELGRRLKSEHGPARVMTANNVLAHVPDIDDFVLGFVEMLAPDGVATFEFAHVLPLIGDGLFDTIYHEHFSYLSLHAVHNVFSACGLSIFDAEELTTHGGSLRVYAQRATTGTRPASVDVGRILDVEEQSGLLEPATYTRIQRAAEDRRCELLSFLLEARERGLSVIGYGAAAKGSTLFNFCGVRSDLVTKVVDRNPAKQGSYLPGSRIPIVAESVIDDERPDYLLVLPWNLRDEITQQLERVRSWGGRFVVALPELEIW